MTSSSPRARSAHRRQTPRRTALAVASAFAVALIAATGCSSEASTRSGDDAKGTTTTAAPVTTAATIPDGVVLRVGDQLDYLKTVLEVSGQAQDFDYDVEYSSFVGGPPMLQAFQGGALDTGFVGSTPLIFAQTANQDLVAVAGWATESGLAGLVTADPQIDGWGSLKGKRVAYQRGTAAEAALLQALDEEGLTLDDVTTVDVPIVQINATLKGGSADAGVSTEPLISLFVAENPDGRFAAPADEITDRSSFLIASQETLDDEGKSAALTDYLTRLVRAFDYLREHREVLADSIFVQQYGLTPERAAELVEQTGGTSFVELPGDIVAQQQQLADLFHEAGQIPVEVDVESEFDTRFNDVVAEAQGS